LWPEDRPRINLAIAIYLLLAKRLFGLRGGGRREHEIRARDTGWGPIDRATPRRFLTTQPYALVLCIYDVRTDYGRLRCDGRAPVVRGLRIPVATIVSMVADGMSPGKSSRICRIWSSPT